MTERIDPAIAVATIRRAAAAMRDIANGVTTVGHEWAVEPPGSAINRYDWTVRDGSGVCVADTPDYGGLELPDHIASWPPPVALLVADVLDALAEDAFLAAGSRWFGRTPAEWAAAYNLAVAFLAARQDGDE